MFQALIYPSSGVCDYVVELPHWLISFLVFCVLELGCGLARVVSRLPAEAAGSPDTTLAEPHPNSNTQQSKNSTANVVVQQHSRRLLKMGILMPETCWETKKKNKNSKWHLVGFLFLNYSCSNKVSVHCIHVPLNQLTFSMKLCEHHRHRGHPSFKNSKVVPVHDMKACRGNRDIAPLILNLGTGCGWVGLPSLPCSQFVFLLFAISHLCVLWNILGSIHRFRSLKRLLEVTFTPCW